MQRVGGGAKLVAFEAGNQMKWVAETMKQLAEVRLHMVHLVAGSPGLTAKQLTPARVRLLLLCASADPGSTILLIRRLWAAAADWQIR